MALGARLGERLVETGLITHQQLEKGLQVHAATGEQLGRTLVKLGYLDEDSLVRTLCAAAGIPYLTLDDRQPEPLALAVLPAAAATRYLALPLTLEGPRVVIAMADPFAIEVVTAVERAAGRSIKVVAAPRDRIALLISRSYDGARGAALSTQPAAGAQARPGVVGSIPSQTNRASPAVTVASGPIPGFMDSSAPGPRAADPLREASTAAALAEEIITRGVTLQATDIHLEPMEDLTRVRYRIDGILQAGPTYPKTVQAPLATRVKILAGIDIAESRLPQDGRFTSTAEGRVVDVRVSTYPTVHGEDIVLRLLDRSRQALDLGKLGIAPDDLELMRSVLRQPHGLLPVTGPTGSGKTTTLYSALAELDAGERCIITLEDPVEYELPHARQAQVNVRAGLTFASGLRSILRHDPDIILVGEIRDGDTLGMALNAALTGHLVLTTLHTTTAAGAIPRLLDMGAEPFVLASSLEMIASQRLIRLLCAKCKQPADVPQIVRDRYSLGDAVIYTVKGCSACRGTGYRGRIGVFEFIPLTPRLAEAIYARRPAEEIQRLSQRPTMLDDGLAKVRAGLTTLDELLRVIAA